MKCAINWEVIIPLVWRLIKWGTLLAILVYVVWSIAEVGIHQLDWDYEISLWNLFNLFF